MADIKRLKQLAGLAPLVEAWDSDDFDRYMNADNSFGVSGQADRAASNPDAVVGDDTEGSVRRVAGVRPPHVGGKEGMVAAKKGPPRRLTKSTIDPTIAAQLAGDDAGEEDIAADASGSSITASPLPALANAAAAAAGDAPAGEIDPNAPPAMARGDKSAKAAAFLTLNPGASRSEFMKFAASELQMGAHYANQFFYGPKAKALRAAAKSGDNEGAAAIAASDMPMEFWVVKNEKGRVLAESTAYDLPTWTTFDQVAMFEPKIFESEIYAKKAVDALAKFGFKKVQIVKENFDEGE